MLWILLAAIGFFVGAFGTLIGVAGGFLLVPVLLYLYPDRTPAAITATTLTVAFFNSLSGSIAYARQKRIDLRSGLAFSIAAIPGAIAGASITPHLNRDVFQILFGSILLVLAVYLAIRPMRAGSKALIRGGWTRRLVDPSGVITTYSFNLPVGMALAFCVGIISGLLGIGGGIVHVPALTQVLGFPVHIATATSQFVVGTSTFAAGALRLSSGALAGIAWETIVLAACAIAGAQAGARISRRMPPKVIVRLLAIALAIVAVRLLIAPL